MYVFTFQKMVVLCRLQEIVIFAIRSEQIVIIPKEHLEQNFKTGALCSCGSVSQALIVFYNSLTDDLMTWELVLLK